MQLPTKDGVACDKCGTSHRHDFTYYSFDFRPVEVHANRRPGLQEILRQPPVFSLDICPACFEQMKTAIIANYNKVVLSPQRRVRVDVVCDLSGKLMAGTYNYYHAAVTKAVVSVAKQPCCMKCKAVAADVSKPCLKCHGDKFIRPISMTTDERHVEINVCEDMYKTLTSNASTVRKVAGEWTSNS